MIADLRPYPEYRESGLPWLGGIPRHWNSGPGFAAFREKRVKNTGMQEETVLSLSYGRIVVKPPEKLHGLVPDSFETYQIVDPGDIIIRSTDLQNDWNSLRVGLVRNRGVITSAYLCFRTTGTLSAEYGYQLLHSFDLMKVFYGLGSGLRQNLDWGDFKRMLIFIPPPEEQVAVVRFLDYANGRVERAIQAKRKIIALLNEQKQAIIHRAVTRGLDSTVPLKPSGILWIGDIPAHWAVQRIKQGVSILRGKFTHRPRNDPSLYDGPYPFIQTGAVARAKKFITTFKQTLNTKGLAVSKLFPKGTLCLTIAANIGDVAMLDFEACFPDSVVGLVPRRGIEHEYLFYVLRCMKPEFLLEAPVNTQGNLSVSRIGAMCIPCPKMEEQIAIVRHIESKTSSFERIITHLEREISLLREYRTRLVADVVTGKLDVGPAARLLPNVPTETEPATSVEADSGEDVELEPEAEGVEA